MRRIPQFLIVLSLIPVFAHAQWERLAGPYGGRILAMTEAVDGALYAAHNGGILYRSTDNGDSWDMATTTLQVMGVPGILATAPDGMLLAANYSDLYRSTDGETWERTNFTKNPTTIAFSDNGDLLIGGRGGVYRSSDDGDSFSTFEPAPGSDRQFKVTVTGNGSWLAGAYRESVYRSTDEGTSWNDVGASLPNNEVYSLSTIDGSTVFVGLNNTTYFTTDLGESWEQVSGLQGVNVYAVHRLSATRLAAESSGGLYFSTDDGRGWSRTAADVIDRALLALYQTSSGQVFAASDGRLLRSTDLGDSWQRSDEGLFVSWYKDILALGSDSYLAVASGAYLSTDAGQSWTFADTAYMPFPPSATLLADDGTIYIATGDCNLRRSTDGGRSWTERLGPDDGYQINSLTETDDGLLASIINSDVFLSTDRGESWERLSSLPQGEAAVATLHADHADPRIVYSGNGRGFARSTDGGKTWEEFLIGGIKRISFVLHQARNGRLFVQSNRSLFYSDDRGETWSLAYEYTEALPYEGITSNSQSNVYISDYDGLLYSEDGTGGWTRVAFPHDARVMSMDDNDFLLIATWHHGIFRSSMTTVGTHELAAAPRSLRIDGVYPQPLRTDATAMVRVTLQHRAALRLQLFDVLGGIVFDSDAGTFGSGTHDLRFYAGALAPGTYTLRVHARGESTMRQVVVVR